MKKLLRIIFLGLLLSSCSSANYETKGPNGGTIARDTFLNLGESEYDMRQRANAQCKIYNQNSSAIVTFSHKQGSDFKVYKYTCTSPQRKISEEYDRYISQCEYIGFKKDTEKMGECVLKLHKTESQLATFDTQQRTSNSSDVLANMFLLNESLKLLNPPQPKSITCQARPFGIYMNVYCN